MLYCLIFLLYKYIRRLRSRIKEKKLALGGNGCLLWQAVRSDRGDE